MVHTDLDIETIAAARSVGQRRTELIQAVKELFVVEKAKKFYCGEMPNMSERKKRRDVAVDLYDKARGILSATIAKDGERKSTATWTGETPSAFDVICMAIEEIYDI